MRLLALIVGILLAAGGFSAAILKWVQGNDPAKAFQLINWMDFFGDSIGFAIRLGLGLIGVILIIIGSYTFGRPTPHLREET